MRCLLYSALLAACASDPPTITVATYPQLPVVFQGADGRVLDSMLTDANGRAIGPMESGGMITYRVHTLSQIYKTLGDLEPGTFVQIPSDDLPTAGETVALTVTYPRDVAGNLVIVRVACGDSWVSQAGTPDMGQIVIAVPVGCLDTNGNAVHVFARDERAEATAFATRASVTVPGHLAIDSWDTQFAKTPYSIRRLDADVDRTLIDVRTRFDDLAVTELAGTVRVPNTTPVTGIHAVIWFSTGAKLAIDRTSMELAIDGSAFMPRIKSIQLGSTDDPMRPTVEVSSVAPIPSTAVFGAELAVGTTGWTIEMRGPLRVPAMPSALLDIGTPRLLGVEVTDVDPDGLTTRTSSLAKN